MGQLSARLIIYPNLTAKLYNLIEIPKIFHHFFAKTFVKSTQKTETSIKRDCL